MAGINEKNYKYLAESIKAAIEQAKWLLMYEHICFNVSWLIG